MHARPPDPQPGPSESAGRRRFLLAGQEVAAPPLVSALYVVATPIGNLGDMTLRGIKTLAAADLIACEDTRVTRKLLEHYGIRSPVTPYHDHNAENARPKILAAIADGKAVALVSDAGTPLVSDPGYRLVVAAREAGHAVIAIPGASSVLAALVAAGLPTDRFFFEGFLPAKSTARRRRLAELARIPASLIVFESGPRLAAALSDLAEEFGDREAAVCRELTKRYEEVRRGGLLSLAQAYAGEPEPRGEIVIVIAPPPAEPAPAPGDVDELLRRALQGASMKDAVAEVASATGVARTEVYRRALALKTQA